VNDERGRFAREGEPPGEMIRSLTQLDELGVVLACFIWVGLAR